MVFTYQIKHFDLLNNFPLKFENSILVTPLRFIITLLNLFCFLEMLEFRNKFISSYEKIQDMFWLFIEKLVTFLFPGQINT